MKIKSDIKSEKRSHFLKNLFKKVGNFLSIAEIRIHIKITIVILLIWFTKYLWTDISGMLSVLIGFITLLYIFNTKPGNEISLVMENLLWTSMMTLLLTIASSADVYDKPIITKEVSIDKYEFIESTEKLVVFLSEPFNKTIVLNLPDSTFFSFRDKIKNYNTGLIVTIEKNEKYDHLNKVLRDSRTTTTTYKLVVHAGSLSYTYGSVCNPGDTDMCIKLFNDEIKN